jgi:hypothetical protein
MFTRIVAPKNNINVYAMNDITRGVVTLFFLLFHLNTIAKIVEL